MSEAKVIRIDPPLPCNAKIGDTTCGQPARAAWVDPILTGENAGQWLLLPICKDCAKTGTASYASERVAEFYAGEAFDAEWPENEE